MGADYVLKLTLLGDGAVGKTSLVYRFIENRFSRDFKSTLGVNLLKKNVQIEGKEISAQIWDLGGQKAYKKLRRLYLEGSQGALVIFDVTSQDSFDNLTDWLESFVDIRGKDTPMILIGNKTDLAANRVISEEQAQAFAKKYGIEVMFTSAATGDHVEESFLKLIKYTLETQK